VKLLECLLRALLVSFSSSLHFFLRVRRSGVELIPSSSAFSRSALTMLRESHPVKKGDWIVVHAAAGGVGLNLCQVSLGNLSLARGEEKGKRRRSPELITSPRPCFSFRSPPISEFTSSGPPLPSRKPSWQGRTELRSLSLVERRVNCRLPCVVLSFVSRSSPSSFADDLRFQPRRSTKPLTDKE